jgi:pimeloyl-ACP methyl ester carboxylesterase
MTGLVRALRIAALGSALSLASIVPAVAATPAATAALPAAPAATSSFDAGTLHVDVYGRGPKNVVLVPGLGSGPWAWYGTIAALTAGGGDARYTIYALTLPGFDGRPATAKTPLFDAFAADFWAMLDAKHVTEPVVIGHSLGGTLAIALAEQHPERLAGIVAVDGLPVFPLLSTATPQKRTAIAAQMAATYAAMTPAAELAGEKSYMASIGTDKPELVDPTAALEATSDPKALAAWVQADLDADLRPNLNRITIPFVEIMPYEPADAKPPMNYTQDQVQAFYQSLIAGAPKATVVVIAPSRHFAMLDQPDAFYAALKRFLGTLP